MQIKKAFDPDSAQIIPKTPKPSEFQAEARRYFMFSKPRVKEPPAERNGPQWGAKGGSGGFHRKGEARRRKNMRQQFGDFWWDQAPFDLEVTA